MAGNLSELNNVNHVLTYLANNENFTKLLYNLDNDPLHTDLPNTPSKYDLITYKKLFPYQKVIDLSEEGADVYVNVYFGKGTNRSNTKFWKTNFLFIEVFVHNDLWKIDTGIRTYQIMNEIDKLINSKTIPNTEDMYTFLDYVAQPSINTKYAGYSMRYMKTDKGLEGGCTDF